MVWGEGGIAVKTKNRKGKLKTTNRKGQLKYNNPWVSHDRGKKMWVKEEEGQKRRDDSKHSKNKELWLVVCVCVSHLTTHTHQDP